MNCSVIIASFLSFFHPTPYFTCNSHLAPLTFSLDLCFHDGSLLAYQLSGDKFIITDPFHCCFLLPCKKNWLEQGLCAPHPPDLILCWALEQYNSNSKRLGEGSLNFVVVPLNLCPEKGALKHPKLTLVFIALLSLSLFLFYSYLFSFYPVNWWKKFFFLSLTYTEVLSVMMPGGCHSQGCLGYLLGSRFTRHLPHTCLFVMGSTIT